MKKKHKKKQKGGIFLFFKHHIAILLFGSVLIILVGVLFQNDIESIIKEVIALAGADTIRKMVFRD